MIAIVPAGALGVAKRHATIPYLMLFIQEVSDIDRLCTQPYHNTVAPNSYDNTFTSQVTPCN